jgi:hypothetical protein
VAEPQETIGTIAEKTPGAERRDPEPEQNRHFAWLVLSARGIEFALWVSFRFLEHAMCYTLHGRGARMI